MLDIKFIRENSDFVKKSTKDKGFDETIVDKLLVTDEAKRKQIKIVEEMRAKKNTFTKNDIE